MVYEMIEYIYNAFHTLEVFQILLENDSLSSSFILNVLILQYQIFCCMLSSWIGGASPSQLQWPGCPISELLFHGFFYNI
jgi:hypothetical protein